MVKCIAAGTVVETVVPLGVVVVVAVVERVVATVV